MATHQPLPPEASCHTYAGKWQSEYVHVTVHVLFIIDYNFSYCDFGMLRTNFGFFFLNAALI